MFVFGRLVSFAGVVNLYSLILGMTIMYIGDTALGLRMMLEKLWSLESRNIYMRRT